MKQESLFQFCPEIWVCFSFKYEHVYFVLTAALHFKHDPKLRVYWKLLVSQLCVGFLETGGTCTCVRNKNLSYS